MLGTVAAVLLSFLVVPVLVAQTPAGGVANNAWMTDPPTSTGIAVGQKIPLFQADDQNGKRQDFSSIRGPHGAALYFMRSADW
jgi:cytochrome oxidase Cu insertion factor (SCO1/SenC/PrrC family)